MAAAEEPMEEWYRGYALLTTREAWENWVDTYIQTLPVWMVVSRSTVKRKRANNGSALCNTEWKPIPMTDTIYRPNGAKETYGLSFCKARAEDDAEDAQDEETDTKVVAYHGSGHECKAIDELIHAHSGFYDPEGRKLKWNKVAEHLSAQVKADSGYLVDFAFRCDFDDVYLEIKNPIVYVTSDPHEPDDRDVFDPCINLCELDLVHAKHYHCLAMTTQTLLFKQGFEFEDDVLPDENAFYFQMIHP